MGEKGRSLIRRSGCAAHFQQPFGPWHPARLSAPQSRMPHLDQGRHQPTPNRSLNSSCLLLADKYDRRRQHTKKLCAAGAPLDQRVRISSPRVISILSQRCR